MYRVRILAENSTDGEYVLSVDGATGALPEFLVSATNPLDGARVRGSIQQITVDFNDAVLLTSLQASDLTVNGEPAVGLTIVDGDTVQFDLPVLSEGIQQVAIAAGAVQDLQGTPLTAFASEFYSDTTAPRVIAISIQEGQVVPAGDLSYTVQFSEPMNVANLDVTDLQLFAHGQGVVHTPSSFSYDVATSTLTIDYSSLPDDKYSLALFSSQFEDLVGLRLDGEPDASAPRLFNTGVDNTGALLPDGEVDSHYVLVSSADPSAPGPDTFVVLSTGFPLPSPWLANGPDSKWIAPSADQSFGNVEGLYVYQTTFDLGANDPSTAVVVGRLSSDNPLQDVLINGRSVGVSTMFEQFFEWKSFVISSGFQAGLNTIEYVVENGGGPTGLRVEQGLIVGSPRPIPPNQSGDGTEGGNFYVSFVLDVGTTAFPTPLKAERPLGSLVYDSSVSGFISPAGDADSYTLLVDPGQKLTVVVEPDTSLRPHVELFRLTNGDAVRIGSGVSAVAGEDAVLQTIDSAPIGQGPTTYQVSLAGLDGTRGLYNLRIILNAAVENENHNGPTNNTLETAQDIEPAFTDLSSQGASHLRPARLAVLGQVDESDSTGDFYSFALRKNQTVTLGLKAEGAGNVQLELLSASGTLLARGSSEAGNLDQLISNFTASSRGTYYVKVTGDPGVAYNLVVTRDAEFDTESNNDFAAAQDIVSRQSFGRQWVAGNVGGSQRLFAVPIYTDTIVELDPATGTEINRIPAPAGTSYGSEGLAYDGDSLFYVAGSQIVWELDPDTGEIIDVDAVSGAQYLTGLAAIDSKIYLLDGAFSDIIEYDPTSDTVTNVLDVDALNPGAFLSYGLAGITEPNGLIATNGSLGEIVEIDPATGLITRSFETNTSILGTAVIEGEIYLSVYFAPEIAVYSRDGVFQRNISFVDSSGFAALGGDDASSGDFYRIDVAGKKTITLETTTPADQDGEFLNQLNPMIRLYDADGNLVASDDDSAADGRNARLSYRVPANAGGTFFVEVAASDATDAPTRGEYVLSVQGARGTLPPFEVTATSIGRRATRARSADPADR